MSISSNLISLSSLKGTRDPQKIADFMSETGKIQKEPEASLYAIDTFQASTQRLMGLCQKDIIWSYLGQVEHQKE